MTRRIIAATAAITAAASATPGVADPGHLATAGGHSHWELLAGLAVIALVIVPLARRALKRR